MPDPAPSVYPSLNWLSVLTPLYPLVLGVPAAVACAAVYGLPAHAVVGLIVLTPVTGLAVTVGFHRYFTHRAFATSRPVEWALMVCGAACGQAAPFSWVATHRKHHRLTERGDDPHSPHVHACGALGTLRGFWHAHVGWTWGGFAYSPDDVRDLLRRPDLVWIDRYWYAWYFAGLALPALAGYLVGGTAYDALIGFLWGGLLRHAITEQATNAVNSVCHLWGSRPYPRGDESRNNALIGFTSFGEGWHNNHHAHPYSARHGFYWWQLDAGWWLIWGLERAGLVWNVKRPKIARPPAAVAAPESPASLADARQLPQLPAG